MNEELDMEFFTDEDLDDAIRDLAEDVLADEERTAVLRPLRFEQMNFAHAVLKYLTKDMDDVSLTYNLHEPFKSMGYITLEGKMLEFAKPEWFCRAAEFASNVEIYPLAQNRVRLTFTFHGLTFPVE